MSEHADRDLPPAALTDLLARAEEGQLAPADRQRLAALLRDDPAARRAYVRLTSLDVLLEEELAGGLAAPLPGLTMGVDDDDDDADAARTSAAAGDALHEERALVLPAIRRADRSAGGADDDDEALAVAPTIRRPPPPPPAWWQRRAVRIAAVLVLGLCGAVLWAVLGREPPRVGTLVASVDAAWDAAPVPVGAALHQGVRLRLRSGLVEASLVGGGARVVVVGPADVELTGPNAARVHAGTMAAHVPPAAHGFRAEAAGLTVIDEGTEFGFSVAPGGATAEVHVFEGRVSVSPAAPKNATAAPPPPPVRLGQGEAVRCDVANGGTLRPMPASPKAFEAALAQIAPAPTAPPTPPVAVASRPTMPAPIARWAFDESPDAGPVARDAVAAPAVADGTITAAGVTRVAGRVGSGALQFDGAAGGVAIGDPPKLDVGGRLTLAAWVRPADLTPAYQNVLARGYDNTAKGEIYLRIKHGCYEIGTWNTVPSAYADPLAAGVWDHKALAPIPPTDVGRWTHLAGVYDGRAWRLYRDGVELIASEDPVGATKVKANWLIGASTGGEAMGRPKGRFFKGAIDDVRIYDVPLTPLQVRELYESTKG